ncbi:hypothetical protein skT53_19550 [Effusibacillus dendaii]|uniref:Uncharacterized protein n=1 Tax=Effusibacillus dendaii TaxID=2743772 RepID=A0A7I8DEJ9_9BACL|nr:hypothetical protein skT53_19550 [Effusibacillus dendaii]
MVRPIPRKTRIVLTHLDHTRIFAEGEQGLPSERPLPVPPRNPRHSPLVVVAAVVATRLGVVAGLGVVADAAVGTAYFLSPDSDFDSGYEKNGEG